MKAPTARSTNGICRNLIAVMIVVLVAAWTGPGEAGTMGVRNASFESPAVPFVAINIDSWEQLPGWESQQSGVFLNQPVGDPTRLDNCDGNQAAFLVAAPQVAIRQDYDSTDWSNSTPTHAFDAKFEVGKSYRLTVGITISSVQPAAPGAILELSLYYRDGASNAVAVAATSLTNTAEVFSNVTHFVDFRVDVPTVTASDAWAGQHIGVAISPGVGPVGGVWDLDNVRLTEMPMLTGSTTTNGQFCLTLESTRGLGFEILASADLNLPASNWTTVGTLTNDTGEVSFGEPATNFPARFYRARQLP